MSTAAVQKTHKYFAGGYKDYVKEFALIPNFERGSRLSLQCFLQWLLRAQSYLCHGTLVLQ